MSPEEEALLRVVRALESEAIPYTVTGSVASSYHGRPRSTHDADVVIDPAAEQLPRLVRRVAELSPGMSVALASAEDTILSKLEWARKARGSEKQIADAVGVLEVNPKLDRAYIEHRARELGIMDLWQEITAHRPPEV